MLSNLRASSATNPTASGVRISAEPDGAAPRSSTPFGCVDMEEAIGDILTRLKNFVSSSTTQTALSLMIVMNRANSPGVYTEHEDVTLPCRPELR